MSAQQNVLVMLTVQMLLGFVHSDVVFSSFEVVSSYHENVVRLACTTAGANKGAVAFYNRVGGTVRNLTLESALAISRELTLQITPESEGEYFCEIGGVRSNNTIILVGELI